MVEVSAVIAVDLCPCAQSAEGRIWPLWVVAAHNSGAATAPDHAATNRWEGVTAEECHIYKRISATRSARQSSST
jgi:hypothetical protein